MRGEVHATLPDWILVEDDYDQEKYQALNLALDAGEASAISLALSHSATVLIDELRGRHAAQQLALPIIGTLGIILRAKRAGLIASGRVCLERLEKHGLWMSVKLKNDLINALREDDL